MLSIDKTDLSRHRTPTTFRDRLAFRVAKTLVAITNFLFRERYGHHAVLLEAVAAVPGMVAASLIHLKCLRRMTDDGGWIRALLDEAENQRTHLMVFVEVRHPSTAERWLMLLAQGFFYNSYFLLYILSPATGHRIVGYLAEYAVSGYVEYRDGLASGRYENVPAPELAGSYWDLPADARLVDVVRAILEDEAIHRDVNHAFADALVAGEEGPRVAE